MGKSEVRAIEISSGAEGAAASSRERRSLARRAPIHLVEGGIERFKGSNPRPWR